MASNLPPINLPDINIPNVSQPQGIDPVLAQQLQSLGLDTSVPVTPQSVIDALKANEQARQLRQLQQQAVTQANESQVDKAAYSQELNRQLLNMTPTAQSEMSDRGLHNNPLTNAIRQAGELATGLQHVALNAFNPEMYKEWGEYYSRTTPKQRLVDLLNTQIRDYNIQLSDFGTKPAREIFGNVLEGMWTNPLTPFADVYAFGGGKLLHKAVDAIHPYGNVSRALNVSRAEAGRIVNKLDNTLREATKLADEAGVDFSEVVKAAETGSTISKAGKPALNKLREFGDEYDKVVSRISPETYVGKQETSITQKILRDRELKGVTSSYAEINREIKPFLDLIDENKFDDVIKLAREGNDTAKQVVKAKALYDKGRIFPVTHALAEVEKSGDLYRSAIGAMGDKFIDAGRFSTRMYGTSTYKSIADQLKAPDPFLERMFNQAKNRTLSDAILDGRLGELELVKAGSKNVKYLSRQDLLNGDLHKALNGASDSLKFADDVAINKNVLDEIKKQTKPSLGVGSGAFNELYQDWKMNMLASAGYIGANLTTGLGNIAMNSNLNDIIRAIKSKGELAKEAGLYRRKLKRKVETPWLKPIAKSNEILGGAGFRLIDNAMANFFSEVALHSELRKAGAIAGKEAEFMKNMDKVKLGKVIENTQNAALLNHANPLPRTLQDIAFTFNPFWRWWLTATQSSLWALREHPLLANVVLMDIVSNIGFDREMQQRLNLGASLDKPFVTIKQDPKTGQLRQASMEFLPINTAIKLVDPEQWFTGVNQAQVPLVSVFNAIQGKDPKGRWLKEPKMGGYVYSEFGNKRFRYNPEKGGLPEEVGGTANEVVNTAIKDMLGAPSFINKTLAPALAPLFSPTGEYYQPYAGSLFGTYTPTEEGTFMTSGNPSSPRTLGDVLRKFGGISEYNYYPEREDRGLQPVSKQNLRDIKNTMRTQNRRMNEYYGRF